jgi:CheY-like chemotaxis protein
VESAAQEVLDKAQEGNVRLALRATGAVGDVDDELGGLLLEVLRNLWSDSLAMQAAAGTARIDCVIREDDDRLIAEVHDPGRRLRGTQEHDVFSRYTGLRRSRPAVESLQGLVWVEPTASPGCRFRVALPRTTAEPSAQIVRIGAHELALPTAAIVGMYSFADVHVIQDEAGAVVEVEGVRHPVLHLAFVLQDVSYDELEREMVVVVGSFERRAALFASGPCWSVTGRPIPGPEGPWSGSLDTLRGVVPVLDIGALLGRRRNPSVTQRNDSAENTRPQAASVLVVNSSEMERLTLVRMLGDASYKTSSVQSAEEALTVLQERSVDLVLCDLRLPEMNAQRIAELRSHSDRLADVSILLVLSHAGEQSPVVVQQLGASDFVRSPIQREELMNAVQRLLGESRA